TGAGMVRLSVTFGGPSDAPHDGWVSEVRLPLTGDVAPGATQTLSISAIAPGQAGRDMLRHRLVKEDVAWFDDRQAVEVSVEAAPDRALVGAPLAAGAQR